MVILLLLLTCVLGRQIQVQQGRLVGPRQGRTHHGKPFLSYLGVPYGAAPEGERRFQLPVPATPWEGELFADRSVSCPQYEPWSQSIVGVEDCLVVNVHATKEVLESGKPATPVMVFIHGGGYVFGDGTPQLYGPDWILDFGVILVTLNYRLGALGFLSTGDKELPANLGLWDQRLALQWVQQNIAAFGGDPGRVTIAGESAGSMSVMFHVLSSQSRGLFQAAIAQSGVPDSRFSHTDQHPAYYARSLATAVGCSPNLLAPALRQCLQALPARALVAATQAWDETGLLPLNAYFFKPVVDAFSSDPFLPRDPHDILLSGDFNKVPIILGYNKEECLGTFLEVKDKLSQINNTNKLAYEILGREKDELDPKDHQFVSQFVEEHFQGVGLTEASQDKVIDMYTDSIFLASIRDTAEILAKNSPHPVFLYRYSHQGTVSVPDLFSRLPKWKLAMRVAVGYLGYDIFTSDMGASHADELLMMFKSSTLPLKQRRTSTDIAVSELMIGLWTRFVKNGRPAEEWKEIAGDTMEHFEIGPDPGMLLDPEEVARLSLWRRLWKVVPPSMHLQRAKSWADTWLYQDLSHLARQEL